MNEFPLEFLFHVACKTPVQAHRVSTKQTPAWNAVSLFRHRDVVACSPSSLGPLKAFVHQFACARQGQLAAATLCHAILQLTCLVPKSTAFSNGCGPCIGPAGTFHSVLHLPDMPWPMLMLMHCSSVLRLVASVRPCSVRSCLPWCIQTAIPYWLLLLPSAKLHVAEDVSRCGQRFCLPLVPSLPRAEFEGQVSLPLSAMSALTSLSVTMDTPELHPLHSLQQWVAPGTASVPGAATAAAAALGSGTSGTEAQPRDAPLCSLQHLSTNAAGLNMVQSMGLLSSCTGLRQLELAGVLPQQLRLPELCMLEHITSLTFKGEWV